MPAPAAQEAAQMPPNTDGIWYASYPPGVPREIDVTQYESLVQYFDECTAKYADRVAFGREHVATSGAARAA